MFKPRNRDVIDLDKYKAIKRPDNEFKIEKVDGVDCVVLDSDNEENVENKKRVPQKVPTRLPSSKKFRQQNLLDSFLIKEKPPTLKPITQPTTSKESTQTDEEKKKWKEIRRRLRSPTFKKNVVENALLAFDRNGPKKRSSMGNRPSTPETSELIRSSPHFNGEQKQPENNAQLSQYGFEKTPPRYWDIDFPTRSEQKNLGLLVEADSPLFKKRRKSSGSFLSG